MDANVPMTIELCASCGIPFAMPTDYANRLRKCHNSFYCPSGHGQHYSAKSTEEKLRDELSSVRQALWKAEDDLKEATKPKKKKTAKKAKK